MYYFPFPKAIIWNSRYVLCLKLYSLFFILYYLIGLMMSISISLVTVLSNMTIWSRFIYQSFYLFQFEHMFIIPVSYFWFKVLWIIWKSEWKLHKLLSKVTFYWNKATVFLLLNYISTPNWQGVKFPHLCNNFFPSIRKLWTINSQICN